MQTDRRQTDGRAIAYSEREREFTFAKNQCTVAGLTLDRLRSALSPEHVDMLVVMHANTDLLE